VNLFQYTEWQAHKMATTVYTQANITSQCCQWLAKTGTTDLPGTSLQPRQMHPTVHINPL